MTAFAVLVKANSQPSHIRPSSASICRRSALAPGENYLDALLGSSAGRHAFVSAVGNADLGTRARSFQHLQRAMGNGSLQQLLTRTIPVQRCGPIPCNCPAEEEALAVQRFPTCDDATGECEESDDSGGAPDPTGTKVFGPDPQPPLGPKLGPGPPPPPKPGLRGPFIDTCLTDPDGFPAQVGDPGAVCLLPGESVNQLCFYDQNGDLKTPCEVVSAPITPVPGTRGPAIDACFTNPDGSPAEFGDPGSVCEFSRNPEQLCFYDANGELKSPCVVVGDRPAARPGGSAAAGRGVLTLGSSGPQVSEVQAALNARSAPIAEDGVFTAETRGAVIKFQAQQHLATDGLVGPRTKAALGLQSTGGLLSVGSTGPEVTEVQAALNANDGPIAEDGIFGMETRGAVIKFQAQQALTPDGIVGSQTKAALGLEPASAT